MHTRVVVSLRGRVVVVATGAACEVLLTLRCPLLVAAEDVWVDGGVGGVALRGMSSTKCILSCELVVLN